jgi:hypothetical protein
MRGMNMRDMEARKRGVQSRLASGRVERARRRQLDEPPPLDESDALELGSAEALSDQGDGMFVRSARRGDDERESLDCPDEPPPGWCET